MKERPILFSTPMVRAILNGNKTVTRRIMNHQIKPCQHELFTEAEWKNEPSEFISKEEKWYCRLCGNGVNDMGDGFKCRYGKVGDHLWIRETWCMDIDSTPLTIDPYLYKASVAYPEWTLCLSSTNG